MKFPIGAALFYCIIYSSAPGQQSAPEKPQIAWETGYDSALEKAKKESKPLFIAFIMDNEPANDEVAQTHYTDPEVVTLSRKMVCLIGNIGSHAASGPCPKFGTITCAQHQAIEKKARAAFVRQEVVRAPQQVFCNSAAHELFRKVYLIAKGELKKSMALATANQTNGAAMGDVAAAEKARIDKLLKDIDSGNSEVREVAFRELAIAADPRAIPAIILKAKPGNEESARISAIKALGAKGNYAAVKPIVELLKDVKKNVVVAAIAALENIELPDPVPDLLALYKSEGNDSVRGRTIRAITKCLPESLEVEKTCLAGFGFGASAQMCASSLLAAASLKPNVKIIAAVKVMADSKNMSIRGIAV
ncbi:MAG: HEAT repeat domain-containing protein [Planctomycetes bacterium]|nr:HEAT repeat domain-containing protein [Planctomycetota bacterium]